MQKMIPAIEFNYLVQNAGHDDYLMKKFYAHIAPLIKKCVRSRYGYNNYYDEVPHDVITRITIECIPKDYIFNPFSYLCRVTHNHLNNIAKNKDNQTLMLIENLAYMPNMDNNLEFYDKETEIIWFKLDYDTRNIIYLNVLDDYKLKEVAQIINMDYELVRTRKSRALKFLKNNLDKIDIRKSEVKV